MTKTGLFQKSATTRINHISRRSCNLISCMLMIIFLTSCSDMYYKFMENFGIHKRDILVDRVEDAQEAEDEAQHQFKSALDQFASVVVVENTDLKQAYEELNTEYEECIEAAKDVSEKIDSIESVSTALFREWSNELHYYQNPELQSKSRMKLRQAKRKYNEMISLMYQAKNSMISVLYILRDNVLFLKHNLNAQAIGALDNEYSKMQIEVDNLIRKMRISINRSNEFIAEMKNDSSD